MKTKKIEQQIIKKIQSLDFSGVKGYAGCDFSYQEPSNIPSFLKKPIRIDSELTTNGYQFTVKIIPSLMDKIEKSQIEAELTTQQIYINIDREEAQEEIKKQEGTELIKQLIQNLDKKTGLNASNLIIEIGQEKDALGAYMYRESGKPVGFIFMEVLLIKGTPELIKEAVIHEYCHYWQHITTGSTGHDDYFKSLCEKLGGTGDTYFEGFPAS